MKVIIEGFNDDIAVELSNRANDAMMSGLETFALWTKIAGIKADLSIEGGDLKISRKETDDNE